MITNNLVLSNTLAITKTKCVLYSIVVNDVRHFVIAAADVPYFSLFSYIHVALETAVLADWHLLMCMIG